MGASQSSPNSPSIADRYTGFSRRLRDRNHPPCTSTSRTTQHHDQIISASKMHKHRHKLARRSYSMPPQHHVDNTVSHVASRCPQPSDQPSSSRCSATVSRSRSNLQALSHKVSNGKGVLRARGKRMYSALRHRVGSRFGLSSSSINSAMAQVGDSSADAACSGIKPSTSYTPTWRQLKSRKCKIGREHARQFRELMSTWSAAELHCLVVEFDAAMAVAELTEQADAARARARSLADDFGALYDSEQVKWRQYFAGRVAQPPASTCDLIVTLDGDDKQASVQFAVHSLILQTASLFFRDLLFNELKPTFDEVSGLRLIRVPSKLGDCVLTYAIMSATLRYFYAGESTLSDGQSSPPSIQLIDRVRRVFGVTPSTVAQNAATLLTNVHSSSDAALVFPPSNATLMNMNRSEAPDLMSDLGVLDTDSYNESQAGPSTVDDLVVGCASSMSDNTSSHHNYNIINPYGKLSCHSVVLAARSPFLRSLIERRLGQVRRQDSGPGNQECVDADQDVLELLLDECVLPRVYAPVLLHALYTDKLDLDKVIRDCPLSVSSLSEVQAIASGKCQLSPVDEATQIYHIAKFLEFDQLAQACESVVVSNISLDSLPSIYNWSAESFGSEFVRRHCVAYLAQEFYKVTNHNCTLLFDLEESLLVETLKSDFVQASEADILNAVIRWGEHQLVRRMEEREPNILSGTTHSISRKGVRRGDMSDEELKEIVWQLLPLVRTDFVIPSTALMSAMDRGLISSMGTPKPSSSLEPSPSTDESTPDQHGHWRHEHQIGKNQSSPSTLAGRRHRRRPRLYLPYVDEARKQLHKRLAINPELEATLVCHHKSPKLPDTLAQLQCVSSNCSHCVDEDAVSLSGGTHLRRPAQHHQQPQNNSGSSTMCRVLGGNSRATTCTGTINSTTTGTTRSSSTDESTTGDEAVEAERRAMLPAYDVIAHMHATLADLVADNQLVNRAVQCGCTYHPVAMFNQLCLRVVREVGLGDDAVRLLRHTSRYYPEHQANARNDVLYEQLLTQNDLVGYADSTSSVSNAVSTDRLSSTEAECSTATGQLPDIMYGTDSYPSNTHLSKSDDVLRSIRVELEQLTNSCVQLANQHQSGTLPITKSHKHQPISDRVDGSTANQRSVSMNVLSGLTMYSQYVEDNNSVLL